MMPTVRKIANPGATTNDERRKTTQHMTVPQKNTNEQVSIGEPLAVPTGWTWTVLGNLIDSMKNGLYKPEEFYGTGTPCLRMYNIQEGKIVWKDIRLLRLDIEEIEDYQLLPGDILVNRVNSRELVGKAAVIPEALGQ